MARRRTGTLWLVALAPVWAGSASAAGNEIFLRSLATNAPVLADGLGRFHAAPAQWTIEGPMTDDGLAVRWAGPADFDGDGRPEWVVSTPLPIRGENKTTRFWVVSPGVAGRSLAVRWSRTETGSTYWFGAEVATGDFNGDGFADLAVGLPKARGNGQVLVFAGSRTNLSSAPVWKLTGSAPYSDLGTSLLAYDVNRDGFADFVVGEPGWNGRTGRVTVFPGSHAGLTASSNKLWRTTGLTAGERFGECLALLDANGDGQMDLAVSAPYFSSGVGTNAGQVRLYLGANGTFTKEPVWQAAGTEMGAGFGRTLCALRDLDKDGGDELAVGWATSRKRGGAITPGEVCLFYGQTNGLAPEPRWRKSGPLSEAWFGDSIAGVGDVNGDGWRDVLIGCPGLGAMPEPLLNGRAYLFLGGSNGLEVAPSWSVCSVRQGRRTGRCVAALGDINGDGLADFAVGTPLHLANSKYKSTAGRIDIFLGQRKGYGLGERFPTDGTNSFPNAQVLEARNERREATENQRTTELRKANERHDAVARRVRWLGWALLGMTGVLAGVYAVGRWQRRRAAQKAFAASAKQERERIARDLHDGVGSELHGIQRLTEALNRAPEGSAEAQRRRGELLAAAQKLGGAMDRLIWSVKPENDTLENLVTFLADYAPRMLNAQGIACELDLPPALPPVMLAGEARQHVFLAVNEALNNVARHAKAQRAWLRASWTAPWLEIVVEDDGCGLSAAPARANGRAGGNGLGNLRARMVSLGGGATVDARNGGGTRVAIRWPLGTSERALA